MGVRREKAAFQRVLAPPGNRSARCAEVAPLGKPEVKESIAKTATVISSSKSPDEAQAWVVGETKWAKIITESGVKPEQ